ncbi:hypothetical protein K491DRAFT_624724 [Lophiostoma macrostomum CBS 122681]|uniref:Uncharacterized protein n=1 Tax=Lophiostoma macrostomum CBS 122681 TaxID=1314788 RepID=A0A6A6TG15_9PLEO|nr:hypothetical protein K491DRAFT_624724 [Lophiostoma macrostomum CBS 122681]
MRTRSARVSFPDVRLRWRPRRRPAPSLWPQSAPKPPQRTFPVPATCYRRGATRALLIQPRDLPADRSKWPALFRQLRDALPDRDSQICLVERTEVSKRTPSRGQLQEDQMFAIDYTCIGRRGAQNGTKVGTGSAAMIAAIGPYAYNARLLKPWVYRKGDGRVALTLWNTNTGLYVDSSFDVVGGQAAMRVYHNLDPELPRVHRVTLHRDCRHLSGPARALSTGSPVNTVFHQTTGYAVTCVDHPRPVVFVRADAVHVDGTILPHVLEKQPVLVRKLESLRRAAAVTMGLAHNRGAVARFVPSLGIVSMSSAHPVLLGEKIKTSQVDIVARFFADARLKPTISPEESDAMALAAEVPGTVVEQLLPMDRITEGKITVGHQSGITTIDTTALVKRVPRRKSVTVTHAVIPEWEGSLQDDQTSKTSTLSSSLPAHKRHSLGMAFVEECRGKSSSYLYPDDPSKHMSRTERKIRRHVRKRQDKLDKLARLLPVRRPLSGKKTFSFMVTPPWGKFRRLRNKRRALRAKAIEEQISETAQEEPLPVTEHRRLKPKWTKIKDASELPKNKWPSRIIPSSYIRQDVRAAQPTRQPGKTLTTPDREETRRLLHLNKREEEIHMGRLEDWLRKHRSATTQIKETNAKIDKVQSRLERNGHSQGSGPGISPKMLHTFFLNQRLKELEEKYKTQRHKREKAEAMCDKLKQKVSETRGAREALETQAFGAPRFERFAQSGLASRPWYVESAPLVE